MTSPLTAAACRDNVEILSILLEANAKDDEKDSALNTALECGHERAFFRLLATGRYGERYELESSVLLESIADTNHLLKAQNYGKDRIDIAVNVAIMKENVDLVFSLLRSFSASDQIGSYDAALERAAESAAAKGKGDIVNILLDEGVDPSYAFRGAARTGQEIIIKDILKRIGDDVKTMTGPALCIACDNGKLGAAKVLVEAGADVDYLYHEEGKVDQTPLVKGLRRGHNDIVEMLLQAGANPDVTVWDGEGALEYARCRRYTRIKRMLIAAVATEYRGVN